MQYWIACAARNQYGVANQEVLIQRTKKTTCAPSGLPNARSSQPWRPVHDEAASTYLIEVAF
jgi:hypothetical protein